MESLSKDLYQEIFLDLEINDLIRVCQTNKASADACRDDIFWSLKYQHDFGEVISRNSIAQQLKLSPRQAYVQKYTQEGGVTYGSQLFISFDKLLPRAILTQDLDLIYFYLKIYDILLNKWLGSINQRTVQKTRNKGNRDTIRKVGDIRITTHIIKWYEVIKAALIAQLDDIAAEFYQTLLIIHDKGNISLFQQDYSSAIKLYQAYLDNSFSEKEVRDNTLPIFEGYILGKNYSKADAILSFLPITNAIKAIIEIGDDDYLSYLSSNYPDLMTVRNQVIGSIKAGKDVEDEDFKEAFPERVEMLRRMNSLNYYPLKLYKELITKEFQQSGVTNYDPTIEQPLKIPCQEKIIRIHERLGFDQDVIRQSLINIHECSPQYIKKYYRSHSGNNQRPELENRKKILTSALINGNYDQILTWLDYFTLHRLNKTKDLIIYADLLASYGYKDLWFYYVSRNNIVAEFRPRQNTIPYDVQLFLQEYQQHPKSSFVTLSNSVYK